jgi:hypothetical protein
MIAATHFDNLLVLLFFAIAIFFQILTKPAAKGRRRPSAMRRRSTSPSQTSHPLTIEPDESDEERVRKFLEALGQPKTSRPPPPVAPRPTYQKPVVVRRQEAQPVRRRSILLPRPPLTTSPPDLPSEAEPARPVIGSRDRRGVRPRVAEAPKFEVHEGPPPITEAEVREVFEPGTSAGLSREPRTKIDLSVLLRSTSSLRNAIILREIFGPPRSLQPLDLVGSV